MCKLLAEAEAVAEAQAQPPLTCMLAAEPEVVIQKYG